MVTYGEAVNCFTDASFIDGTTCSGYVLLYRGEILEHDAEICSCKTNNYGEAYAIYLGIKALQRYSHLSPYLNLFSDSKISTDALNCWIYNWVKNQKNGVLYNYSNNAVANQDIFKYIVYFVYSNNLNINIFHQLAHKDRFSDKCVQEVKERFFNENGILLSDEIVIDICKNNDFIDKYTRNTMINAKKRGYNLKDFGSPIDAITRTLDSNIVNEYMKLLHSYQ